MASKLDQEAVFDILRNRRRRIALYHLAREGTLDLASLADRVAADESNENPPPRNLRESVYTSLHQTHLPKLDDLGIVSYTQRTKQVSLLEPGYEVLCFTGVMTGHGIPWHQLYLVGGTVGFLAVIGADLGLPGIALIRPAGWGLVFLTAFVLAAALQWLGAEGPPFRLPRFRV